MLVDAGDADRGAFARAFDACVIGAGPAGITLARRLAAQGFSVALMEGGGLELSPSPRTLYAGEVVGLDYYPLDGRAAAHASAAPRCTGAAAAARSTPTTSCPRPYAPLSGWPIARPTSTPTGGGRRDPRPRPAPGLPDLPIAQAEARFRRVPATATAPADPLRREVPRRDRRLPDRISLRAQRQPRRPAPRRRASARRDRGASSRSFAPGDPRLRRPGAGLRALLSAASRTRGCCSNCHSQLPRGHRQPARPGRPVLLRASALRARPSLLRAADPGGRDRGRARGVLRPDRGLHGRSTGILSFRLQARARPIEPPLSFAPELLRSAGCVSPSPSGWPQRGARPRPRLRPRRARRCTSRRLTAARRCRRGSSCASPSSRSTATAGSCSPRRRDPLGLHAHRASTGGSAEIDYRDACETAVLRASAPIHRRAGHRPASRLADWLLAEPPRLPGLGRGQPGRRPPPHVHHADERRPARRAWSTPTAGCTGCRTSTSAARASSPPAATPTRPTPSCSSRSASATTCGGCR